MKDFKSYKPNENDKKNDPKLTQSVDFAKTIANAMNGKSEGQILKTIIAEAERGKRNGTLSNEDIDKFAASVAPFLDGQKRKKLKEVVAKLKEI